MNLLREIRKFNKKSIQIKIRLLSMFLIMLIISTYAWFSGGNDIHLNGLEANVESWDIQYVVDEKIIDNDVLLDEEFIIQLDDIRPGVSDYSKNVKVYNMGSKPSEIYVEIASIKVFGQELLGTLDAQDAIKYTDDGKTVKLFETAGYPFDIGYSYDKKIIQGQYKSETDVSAKSTLTFKVDWNYEGNQDFLDTTFGKRAYDFYQINGQDANAIEIRIKVVARVYQGIIL